MAITTVKAYDGGSFNPYYNLAAEEYLMRHVKKGELIFRLWQNRHTVVIGKNQNPYMECRTALLENEGGNLARRLTGGGAVYHDLGNLNFTFITKKSDYDYNKQIHVVTQALNDLGINAEASGRNDITADGRKISGNAFCIKGDNACHHGTVLIDVDIGKLTKYLTPSPLKLSGKGISSVSSRVVNLKEICLDVTTEKVKSALFASLFSVYGKSEILTDTELLGGEEFSDLTEKYRSFEWRYGSPFPFSLELSYNLSIGSINLQFLSNTEGKISDCKVFSDCMEVEFIDLLPRILKGKPLKSSVLAKAVTDEFKILGKNEIASQLAGLLLKENF